MLMSKKTHDFASSVLVRSSGSPSEGMQAARPDLLSQLLNLIRLRGDLIYSAELSAPWALAFPPGPAHFHFVEEGRVFVTDPSAGHLVATAGDLLLLPSGVGHALLDDP